MGTDDQKKKKQDKAGETKKTEPVKEKSGAAAKEKGREADAKAGGDEDSHKCCGCRFPVIIALLQLVLGIAIAVVAFIMKSISSSLLARDTPYWVGIILIYFLLCALGLILCISAVAFAAHHYNQITKFTCQMNADQCVCKQDPNDQIARTFQYNDVSDCASVTRTIKLYLLLQMVLNLTLAIICLLGCYVMWKHRYQVFFVGLLYHPFKSSNQQQQKV
ncbi:sarcospan isoform X2 [Heterodontus francisci]|uniref:sarcospan isoform X2 n=1 Tax=Heterodontus francisci TaxID=7792 RepID=UPI00355B350A